MERQLLARETRSVRMQVNIKVGWVGPVGGLWAWEAGAHRSVYVPVCGCARGWVAVAGHMYQCVCVC